MFTRQAGRGSDDQQNSNRRSQEQKSGAGPSTWVCGEYSEQRLPP